MCYTLFNKASALKKKREVLKMKKKTIIAAISAFVAAATLVGTVIASNGQRSIDIVYDNIKIFIDGAEYVAKDVNGNVVEPFIYNGTTYLPVRGIANAFDKEVIWDGENSYIYLGKTGQNQPDTYLSKLQYTDYRESEGSSNINIINGKVTDYNDNDYTNGLLLSLYFKYYSDKKSTIEMDYPLNNQYKRLTGKIVLPKSYELTTGSGDCRSSETTVTLVADDGEEIYKATGVTASMPFSFDVSVKGVNKLTLKVYVAGDSYVGYKHVALTDLALYEK